MSCICDKCMNFPCGEETNMIIVCCDFEEKPKVVTNADRIRQMTDEKLATEIVKCRDADDFRKTVLGTRMNTTEEWLDWLKSPVEVDE